MNNKGNHNDFLNLLVYRGVMEISKSFLNILEDFKKDNIISEEYYYKLRSQILGRSNDKIREFKESLDRFNVELKRNKE